MSEPSKWAVERVQKLFYYPEPDVCVRPSVEQIALALDAARTEGRREALEEAERVARNLALKLALKRKRGRSVLRVEAAAEYCASRISALMDKETNR